jgi:hypothetical protein
VSSKAVVREAIPPPKMAIFFSLGAEAMCLLSRLSTFKSIVYLSKWRWRASAVMQ